MNIEQRIERLEKNNQLLKSIAYSVILVLLGIGLLGAKFRQGTPSVIRVRGIELVDEDGLVRAEAYSDGSQGKTAHGERKRTRGAGFRVLDRNGLVEAELHGNGVDLYDQSFGQIHLHVEDGLQLFGVNGKTRTGVETDGISVYNENRTTQIFIDAAAISVHDAKGTVRSLLASDGITYVDERGNIRASLGHVVITNPTSGAETTYPAAVVLYDAGGNVIWQAPPSR